MPELPEVETIARGLAKRVTGDMIESVWIGSKPEPLKSSARAIAGLLEGAGIERVHRAGKHIVIDLNRGPGKDLAGYWIVDVDSPERAYEIAAKASAAPGPGGKPMSIPFEVRRVMTGQSS